MVRVHIIYSPAHDNSTGAIYVPTRKVLCTAARPNLGWSATSEWEMGADDYVLDDVGNPTLVSALVPI